MDLSQYELKSFSDPEWIEKYIAKMGEEQFWLYRDKVYSELDELKLGEKFAIQKWVNASNYDLFMKIASVYIAESNYCYEFNPECTIITYKFDKKIYETLVGRTKRVCIQTSA